MKTWPFAVVVFALLAAGGCRTDPAIPLLERQLRLQEDEIYRLRGQLEDMRDSSDCREVHRSPASKSSDDEDSARHHAAPDTNGKKPPTIEMPSAPTNTVPDTLRGRGDSTPPGVPEVPKELQGPSKPTSDNGPALGGRVSGVAGGAEPLSITPSGDSRQVAAIALNRSLTGGINSGDQTGDQGLLVVVEPRDREGRTIAAPAEMSVLVLDPSQLNSRGKAARVGRWDFNAAETAAAFRHTDSGDAVHLAMAWPAAGPKHGKLHVFVRYTTGDGRRLETDGPIEVALPGDKTAGWRPAPPSARTNPPVDEETPATSWRRSESPAESEPPLVATRPDTYRPERPAWSPERR